MEKITKKYIDDLTKNCKSDKINENTYCLWYEINIGIGPICSCNEGGWYWSNDLNKISELYINYILRGFIESLCYNYTDKDLTDFTSNELIDLIDENMYFKLNSKLKELKNYLNIKISSFKELKNIVIRTTKILKSLDVSCNATIYDNFEDVYQLVYAHKDGRLKKYEAKEDLLNDDVIC